MKKILIAAAIIVLIAMSANAASVLFGGGVNLNMYKTNEQLKARSHGFQMYGVGVTTETNWLGGMVPDQSFLIYKYEKTNAAVVGGTEKVMTYEGSIAGMWYLGDISKKFLPFLMLRNNIAIEDAANSSTTYWSGQVGVGASYPIAKNTKLWLSCSVEAGEEVNSDIGLGIKLEM